MMRAVVLWGVGSMLVACGSAGLPRPVAPPRGDDVVSAEWTEEDDAPAPAGPSVESPPAMLPATEPPAAEAPAAVAPPP